MAQLLKQRGAYWETYPLPDNPTRCFVPRTLVAAFGPRAELHVPVQRRMDWRNWVMVGVALVACLAMCAAVAAARAATGT